MKKENRAGSTGKYRFRLLTAAVLAVCLTGVSLIGFSAGSADTDASAVGEVTAQAADVDMSQLLDMNELTGWATVSGFGTDTVTGGGNASPQIVTTTKEFVNAVSGDTPAVIVVSGTIDAVADGGYAVSIGSNKTIVGIDSKATLTGGISIKDESNIIISNLTLKGYVFTSRTPDDVVHIEGMNTHHIWLNHLDISNANDGNLDITSGANFITVSWCKFSYSYDADKLAEISPGSKDHRLSCLIGSGAGDHDDTDYGNLRVTYHHNWFADNCNERMPRVMYGKVHVYNNYYSCTGNAYCVGADSYASVLIENNYFYKVKNPHEFSYPSGSLPATITARGNKYVETSGKQDSGQKPNTTGTVAAFEEPSYVYWLDGADDVPALVQSYAGPRDYDPSATPVPVATPKPSTAPTAEPTPQPTLEPTATPQPAATDKAPVRSEDETYGEVYEFKGQNSDKTNGQVTIKNPFAGLDLSETPAYSGSYPSWKNAVTLTYWEYIPSGVSTEGVALNFYGTHRTVSASDWQLIERGEEGYGQRFEDENGKYQYSLVREGDVLSSLQFSTFGSIGYSEDDCISAWNVNPYCGDYGAAMDFQQKNYYYIFANKTGTTNTLVSDKGSWHFVAHVIQNDGTTTYIDGVQTGTTQYNVWGDPKYTIAKSGMYVGGQAFNLGYGWKGSYRASSTSPVYSHGMTILDFLSLENTQLTVGGGNMLWDSLNMDFTTPSGIKIGGVTGYAEKLTASEIKTLAGGGTIDKVPADEATPAPVSTATPAPVSTATPAPVSTATPAPQESDTPGYQLGDVDRDGKVTANDALKVLRYVVELTDLDEEQQLLADVDGEDFITASDALAILRYVVGLIEEF